MAARSPIFLFDFLTLQSQPLWWDYSGLELWKFFNLVVFVAVAFYLVRRPLTDAFRSRREGIRQDLLKAREERDKALFRLAEVEARVARLDSEVAAIMSETRAEAAAERDRIARETEGEMQRLREKARREIERAGRSAKQELQQFAAVQCVKLAEEVLRRDMEAEDHARLIALSIKELGGSGN